MRYTSLLPALHLGTHTISQRERLLLALAGVFVTLNHLTLILAIGSSWSAFWPILVWFLCAALLHLVLSQTVPNRDPFIVPIVMLLSGWGLTLVMRLAPPFGPRQVVWLAVSSAACAAMTVLPATLRVLRRYRYTWLLLGLALLGTTFLFGVNPSGDPYAPRLWLGFAGVYFQPSEILKLLLVVFLASYLAEKRDMMLGEQAPVSRAALPYLAPMLLMWGFCMILLIWQRDLGAASLFFLIFLAMLFAATGQRQYVWAGLVLLVIAAAAGYLLYGVVRLRIDTWLNPWPEADNRAFQIVQSLMAVASGGVLGEGVGLGAPIYIPVVHSDFAFAAIAEEWGMAGAVGVVVCILLLVMRALRMAVLRESTPFRALLAAGVGVSLGIQSLLIMGGVLKIIPLTGVTLPFVSYGGSSLLSSFIMVGLLLRISDPDSQFELPLLRSRAPQKELTP